MDAASTTLELQPGRDGGIPCSDWLGRIVCGDNTEILSGFPAECVDLVVTSPPYDELRTYGGHSWNFETLAAQLVRVLKPGGVIVWVVADATVNGSETLTSMRQAIHFKDVCGLLLWDTMIWNKGCQTAPTESRYYAVWEYMFVLSKGKPKTLNLLEDRANITNGAARGLQLSNVRKEKRELTDTMRPPTKERGRRFNLWTVNPYSAAIDHPAVFPADLAVGHVQSWSNPGDVILDPFAGSGTTLKAAKELNRQWCGIEINPAYCAIAEGRLSQDVLQLEAAHE